MSRKVASKRPYESLSDQSYLTVRMFSWYLIDPVYTCDIHEDGDRSKKSTHDAGKTDDDVKSVTASTFTKFPRGMSDRFKNLQTLVFDELNFSEIKREDFKGLENLKNFSVFGAPLLRHLDGDIFDDLKALETIGFYGTNISSIGEKLLSKLTNLKLIFFMETPVINAAFVDSSSGIKWPAFEVYGEYTKVPSIHEFNRLIKNCSPCDAICADLKNLLCNESFKDFTITVKSSTTHGLECTEKCCNEVFKVHKFLLIARSPVLADMITKSTDAMNLNLIDIPPNAFKHVIEYIYHETLPSCYESSLIMNEILALASKFGLRKLKEFAKCKVVMNLGNNAVLEQDNKVCAVDQDPKMHGLIAEGIKIAKPGEDDICEKFKWPRIDRKELLECNKELFAKLKLDESFKSIKQDDDESETDEMVNWDEVVEATQQFHEKSKEDKHNVKPESEKRVIIDASNELPYYVMFYGDKSEESDEDDDKKFQNDDSNDGSDGSDADDIDWDKVVNATLKFNQEKEEEARKEAEMMTENLSLISDELENEEVKSETPFELFVKSIPATGINKGIFDFITKRNT